MSTCDVCHNEYDDTFTVTYHGRTHTFDSFECAIHALAPQCKHCGCRILGHGMEARGGYYCCANCARQEGVKDLKDHQ